ncbi:MAG: DNA repair protein RecO, partial [Ignavibacteria bacterium]
ISAIVKGARNFKSKLCGVLESMNYINAIIYLKSSRELQLVTGAEYKRSFANIITDLDKLQAAYRIIEMLNKSVINYDANQQIFQLLIRTYELLNNSQKNIQQCVLYFQIKLVRILGVGPDFTENDSDFETFFQYNEFCLSKYQIKVLSTLKNNSIENLPETEIEENILISLIEGYEKYLLLHTHGHKFYKSKKIFMEIKSTT